jgi:hypothetical protein
MAQSSQDIPYHFHAGGHAFSAHFVRPVDVPIAAQAATSLPSIGGFAHSRVEDFVVSRLVSFKMGETHVAGSWEEPTVVTTSATAVLEDLRVLDFLTVDKIVSRLSARYEQDDKNRDSHIMALGSHFVNFRLGGFEVKVTLRHDLLVNAENFDQLTKSLKNDKKAVVKNCVAFFSLVEKLEVDPELLKLDGFEVDDNRLIVPHFGKIAFAEVVAGPGSISLTMLRFKLGSPDGGGGSGGQTHTNGQPPPP